MGRRKPACLLRFIGREYACTYASSFYLLRTIFVGSFGVERIRRSFDYVVDPTVRKVMCVVAMYDDVSKTCAEMEDFVWNFGHRVVRGESSISSSLFRSSFSFLFSFFFLSLFRFISFSFFFFLYLLPFHRKFARESRSCYALDASFASSARCFWISLFVSLSTFFLIPRR